MIIRRIVFNDKSPITIHKNTTAMSYHLQPLRTNGNVFDASASGSASVLGSASTAATSASLSESLREGLHNALPHRVQRMVYRHRAKKASKSIKDLLRLMRDAELQSETEYLYRQTLATGICTWANNTMNAAKPLLDEICLAAEPLWTVSPQQREDLSSVRSKLQELSNLEILKNDVAENAIIAERTYKDTAPPQRPNDQLKLMRLETKWRVLAQQAACHRDQFQELSIVTFEECSQTLFDQLATTYEAKLAAIRRCQSIIAESRAGNYTTRPPDPATSAVDDYCYENTSNDCRLIPTESSEYMNEERIESSNSTMSHIRSWKETFARKKRGFQPPATTKTYTSK